MRLLFISLLLLTLVGCAHSNFAWHWPAFYFNDSKRLADLNPQKQDFVYVYPYTYAIVDW